jgi:hypothetical protein
LGFGEGCQSSGLGLQRVSDQGRGQGGDFVFRSATRCSQRELQLLGANDLSTRHVDQADLSQTQVIVLPRRPLDHIGDIESRTDLAR